MALLRNTYEAGVASGTAVLTTNSANPDAFTAVTPGAGGSINYSTSVLPKTVGSTLSLAFTPASAVACYAEWGNAAGASSQAAFRDYFTLTGLPSTGQALWNIRTAGGGTSLISISLSATGLISAISDVAAVTMGAMTTALALNTNYRIEAQMDNTGGAAAGTLNVQIFAGESTTPIGGCTLALTGQNLGTGVTTSIFGTLRFGRVTAAGTMAVSYHDDTTFQTASATALGPSTVNALPVGSAGSDILNGVVGTAISRTATATDSDGTIASRQWSVVSYPSLDAAAPTLTGATTATLGFTPSAQGIYVFSFQATDNVGGVSTPSTFSVYVPGLAVRPKSVTSQGGWTLTGSSMITALTDGLATTYEQSAAATATPSLFRMRLEPILIPTTFALALSWLLSIAGTGTAKVRLYEGATLRKEWIAAAGTIPTTTEAVQTFALTSGEIATFTSWLTIDLEVEWGV